MPQARPLTLNEWRRTSARNRGKWTYSKYRRWWFKTVAPRVGRNASRVATYDPLAPLSEGALENIAAREARLTLDPQRTELERIRRQTAAQYAARGKDIQGFGLAGAESLKSIGPQIQQGYSQAAGETASFAKGYADANTALSKASASGAGEVLAAAGPTGGAPTGQVSAINAAAGAGALGGGTAGAALHDVTYAQGEIPASGLAREGAAFGAAAGFLPNALLGLTNSELMKANQDATAADTEFVQKLTDLQSSRPELVSKIMQSLRDNELQKVATAINREYLGIKGKQQKLDAKATALKAGLDAKEVDEQLSASNKYLTNKYGQPILDENGRRTPYKKYVAPKKPGTKKNAAGLTPGQVQTQKNRRQTAINTAITSIHSTVRSSFSTTGVDKDFNSPTYGKTVSKPKYKWAQARNMLWDQYGNAAMGYASQGGKAALKKRINNAINNALLAAGYKKPTAKKPPKKKPTLNPRPGQRPRPGSLFGTVPNPRR